MAAYDHIIFEDVKDFEDYAFSRLGDFKILIRKSDGFINISKFLKTYRTGKRQDFYEWKIIDSNSEYVNYLAKMLPSPLGDDSTIKSASFDPTSKASQEEIDRIINPYDKTLPNKIKGTYVHVNIAYAVAMWISPIYLHKVIEIIKEYDRNKNEELIKQLKKNNNKLKLKFDKMFSEAKQKLFKQNTVIREKVDKIDELKNLMDEMRQEMRQESIKRDKERAEESAKREKERKELLEKVDIAIAETKSVKSILQDVEEDIVSIIPDRSVKPKVHPKFVLLRLFKYDTLYEGEYMYYAIRRQKDSISQKIKALREIYPDLECVVEIKNVSPVLYFRELKRRLQSIDEWDGCPTVPNQFAPKKISEEKLIDIVKSIEQDLSKGKSRKYEK